MDSPSILSASKQGLVIFTDGATRKISGVKAHGGLQLYIEARRSEFLRTEFADNPCMTVYLEEVEWDYPTIRRT